MASRRLPGRHVSDLSSGQGERAAVARAVAGHPSLLADEPTARLDQANALAVARLLLSLARETGAAVVCATHDPLLIEHADELVDLEAHRRAAQEGLPLALEPRGFAGENVEEPVDLG